ERGLAATRAANDTEPSVRSQLLDGLRDRLLTTKEPIAVIGAVSAQTLIGALGRRRRPEVLRRDRIYLLTRGKTSKRVRSEVHDRASSGGGCTERLVRFRRKKNVAAVRKPTDSCRQIH